MTGQTTDKIYRYFCVWRKLFALLQLAEAALLQLAEAALLRLAEAASQTSCLLLPYLLALTRPSPRQQAARL
jgi:hypothetical protein